MPVATVQAYRVPIIFSLDHTYISSGTQGNPPPNYYACWGPSYQESNLAVCNANIIYNRANCYRDSIGPIPDTASIGIYGVNGVCHQSANCFLFSSGVQLNFEVSGYWISLLLYGPYGTHFYSLWLPFVYGICSIINPWAESEMPEGAAAEPSIVDKIRNLYASSQTQTNQPDPNDRIIAEAATVTKHLVPTSDPAKYQDLHAELLKEKDAIVATGITGPALADKLNNLAKQMQGALAQRVGPEMYKKLNGVSDASHKLNLFDPRLVAQVGRPVPPFKHG